MEVPIDYRRRADGPLVRPLPGVFARVRPAVWREWRASRGARAASASASSGRQHVRPRPRRSPNSGSASVSGPERGSGRPAHQPARAPAHVGVEPDRCGQREQAPARCRSAARGAAPRRPAGRERQRRPAGARRGTRSRTWSAPGRRRPAAVRQARRRSRVAVTSTSRMPGQRAGEALAARAEEQPEPDAGDREDGRPAQQPVFAVDEQRDQAVDALEVAAGEAGVGGGLARRRRPSTASARRRAPR